jgi:hypothetical protein
MEIHRIASAFCLSTADAEKLIAMQKKRPIPNRNRPVGSPALAGR